MTTAPAGRLPRTPDVWEDEANIFAMQLLMPAHWLAADIPARDVPLDPGNDEPIRALAERYDVPLTAMALRLHELGYFRRDVS